MDVTVIPASLHLATLTSISYCGKLGLKEGLAYWISGRWLSAARKPCATWENWSGVGPPLPWSWVVNPPLVPKPVTVGWDMNTILAPWTPAVFLVRVLITSL